MENIRIFLEASTIHGMVYISTTTKLIRVFWVLVVIAGFTGAGVLIYQSFQDWDESPITTSIDTLPISKLPFPKVTVCPPKNTFTNLNYDVIVIMAENMTIDNDTKDELFSHAIRNFHDKYFDVLMLNYFGGFFESNRYHNWYNGLSKIDIPYFSSTLRDFMYYDVDTYATFGFIQTKYFANNINDYERLYSNISSYTIQVHVPYEIAFNPNFTLHAEFEIQKDEQTRKNYTK